VDDISPMMGLRRDDSTSRGTTVAGLEDRDFSPWWLDRWLYWIRDGY
jgi:hypothetical protein